MKLRKEIAKRFEVDYKNIRITRVNLLSFNNDIPDSDNGKILSDISLSNFEYLEVRKKNIPKKEKMKQKEEKAELSKFQEKEAEEIFRKLDKNKNG